MLECYVIFGSYSHRPLAVFQKHQKDEAKEWISHFTSGKKGKRREPVLVYSLPKGNLWTALEFTEE